MASGILGGFSITGENEPQNLLVLRPYHRALLEIAEDSPHRAFEMRPLRRDGLFDRPVPGQAIERRVKSNIGLDKRKHWSIGA